MSPELMTSVIGALSGLGGVVVGGMITASIEKQKMEQEAKREDAKVQREEGRERGKTVIREAAALHEAARLVTLDFESGLAMIEAMRGANVPIPAMAVFIHSNAWTHYRAVLATYLLKEEWGHLSRAVTAIERLTGFKQLVSAKMPLDSPGDFWEPLAQLMRLGLASLQPYLDWEQAIAAVGQAPGFRQVTP